MLLLLLKLSLTPVVSVPLKNSACHNITEERWREVSSLMEMTVEVVSRETVCEQVGVEGNYTGQVEAGRRDGWGEMIWENGTLYGPGNIFYYSRGDRYFGQWEADRQSGLGTLVSQTGVYVGEWEEGVQSGEGTARYNNGNNYTGQFRAGQKHGSGVFKASNGDVYTGQFKAGVRHGQGIETFYNGEKYVGQYEVGQQPDLRKETDVFMTFPAGGHETGSRVCLLQNRSAQVCGRVVGRKSSQ